MATVLDKLTPEEAINNLRDSGYTKEADSAMKNFDAINSSTLKSEPEFKLTPMAPATAAPALQGQIESVGDQFTQDLQQRAKEADAMKDITQREYLSSILGTDGEVEATAKEFSRRGGVDDIDKELVDINNQIRQEQNALRRQVERVQTEAGLTKGQVNQRVGEIERVSLRKQADLAVIQMGIQGRYDSAKTIADRAVAVKMEQQARVNEVLRVQYEDNKELFNKTEQRLFESSLADRERAFKKEEADEQAKYNLAIEAQKNGAPTSIVSAMLSSDSKETALETGGSYIGVAERLNIKLLGLKVNSEIQAQQQALQAQQLGLLTSAQYETADSLRKEYNNLKEVKDSKDLQSNVSGLLLALEQKNGSGDISAINTFQRLVVDPGVAVREGDVSLLQSAQSFTDKSALRARGLLVGDKLTEKGRLEMKTLALQVYDARVAIIDSQVAPIKTMATERGIEFGKYIGTEFEKASDIEARVEKIQPAQAVLDSYDDSIFSDNNLSSEANNFFTNFNLLIR